MDTNYKSELEIKRLILELLKDGLYSCSYTSFVVDNIKDLLKSDKTTSNYEMNKKSTVESIYKMLETYHKNGNKNKKEELKKELLKFKKEMFLYLNDKALPDLIFFYNKLKHLLPFKLMLPLHKNNII